MTLPQIMEDRKGSPQGSGVYFFSIMLVILAHFFAACRKKTGLSAPIFWLRQKDFRFYPLCPTGFLRFAQFYFV
jgi:hypothetical protein